MAEKKQKSSGTSTGNSSALLDSIQKHIVTILGNDYWPPEKGHLLQRPGLLRARPPHRAVAQPPSAQYYDTHSKRVYYLSMEFLPGRFFKNYHHQPRD